MNEQTCDAYVLAFGVITCRCGKLAHGPDKPHECEDKEGCNGAWFGDGVGKEYFEVVRYPSPKFGYAAFVSEEITWLARPIDPSYQHWQ